MTPQTTLGPVIPREEYEAKGRELFGPDPYRWEFVCPACGNVASVEMARARWPEVKGNGWQPWSECIGRYTRAAGCDWAAYGLFCGPLKVQSDHGVVYCFDFAGHPFSVCHGKGLDSPLPPVPEQERDKGI